ncbi:hypothetical protein, partial [Pseudomonas simiae]|uniref:hypothetical protein n=1 Tax=Pseudomonas simiae TaxID=321846 RepID=UPI0020953576
LTRTQAVRPDASHPGFALDGLHQGRTEKFGLGAIFPHPPRGLGWRLSGCFPSSSTPVYQSGFWPLWKQLSAAQSPLRYHSIFV